MWNIFFLGEPVQADGGEVTGQHDTEGWGTESM